MAVIDAVRRFAARTGSGVPAPVFAAVGAGARDRVEALELRPEIDLVSTPRHAALLLVAGAAGPDRSEWLARTHDQIPHPRATLRWGADPLEAKVGEGGSERGGPTVPADDDPVPALLDLHRTLFRGDRQSEPPLLPDEPPTPWRGRGEHGQGGEGMMGGTPYGRPMAMTGPDVRDGLSLDRLELTVGPFLPPFPPGLVMEVALQGDVVQGVEVLRPPDPQPLPAVFDRIRREPVRRSELETARVRVLLRRVARVLRSAGATALAHRALAASESSNPSESAVDRLRSILRHGGGLAALGTGDRVPAWGDPRRRVRGWLTEALRTTGADGAEERRTARTGPVESLEQLGPPFTDRPSPDRVLERLPRTLPGLEWTETVLLLATADPVPTEKGRARP